MSKDKNTEQMLKDKIEELQHELAHKELEAKRYRMELQKANSALEKLIVDLGQELRLASLIQKLLSPTEIPNIPGIEFSTTFDKAGFKDAVVAPAASRSLIMAPNHSLNSDGRKPARAG